MPSSRRVALVFDTAGFAGAEISIVALAGALRERIDFVALVGPQAPDALRTALAGAGVEVREVRGLTRYATPAGLLRLVRAVRELDPAIVNINLTDPGDGTAPLVAARLWGAPTAATLQLVIPGRAAWREAVTRFAFGGVDRVIAISDSVAEYARAKGAATTVVRHGIVAPDPHPDPRGDLGVPPDAFVVGGVGRLHRQKGWDVLCRAAALVHRERDDVHFVVVGEGDELGALQALEECAHVHFAGHRSEAARLVAGFDVMVVPSRYEGLGLVAAEAMFSGVPVVASDTGGLPEVVGDAGLLVAPEDPQALATAILRLAGDAGLRADLSAAGRARAGTEHALERMAAETLAVYRDLAPGIASA